MGENLEWSQRVWSCRGAFVLLRGPSALPTDTNNNSTQLGSFIYFTAHQGKRGDGGAGGDRDEGGDVDEGGEGAWNKNCEVY